MILRYINSIILCCLLFSHPIQVLANNAISIGVGPGTADVWGYRLNLQRAWANDGFTINKRRLTGYWELAVTNINTSATYTEPKTYPGPINTNTSAFSGSIVLRVPFTYKLHWYFDIGVGLAYVTDQHIATRDLGCRWLFDDRLGLGILLGKRQEYEVGYRLTHFSNGYLAQTNQGINLHLLILGYWFL